MECFNRLRTVCLFSMLFAAYNLYIYADPIDEKLNQVVPRCFDVTINAMKLIPEYYENGSLDTVFIISEKWGRNCGMGNNAKATKVLLAILNNTYHDSLVDTALLYEAQYYESALNNKDKPEKGYFDFDWCEVRKKYYAFLANLADSLAERQQAGSMPYLLCLFYGGKFEEFYHELLSNPAYSNSALYATYCRQVEKYLDYPQYHAGIYVGPWVPQDKLKIIGIHPTIGFNWGRKVWLFTFDMHLAFRFLESENAYVVKQNGKEYTTDHYFGGNMGVDLGADIYKAKRNQLLFYCGVSADGFDALTKGQSEDDQAISTFMLGIDPGLEYRFYYSKGRLGYVGLKVRYNIVDYTKDNNFVTDLSGNAFSFELVWGAEGNAYAIEGLDAMRYYKYH